MIERVELVINEEKVKVEDAGEKTLLTFLRDEMGLVGVKNGCSEGHCGACTVIVNGKAQLSCLLKLKDLSGSTVETIENLGKEGSLHPLQVAFLETGAVQCGFCTPGMIMSAKALLDTDSSPDEKEIKKALSSNICRCTGYKKIIEAVSLTGKYLRTGKALSEDDAKNPFGKPVIRNDGIDKVTGKGIFVDDLYRDGMLHGKLHLSSEPHAEIIKIDTSRAYEVEGVVKVITHEDIPGRKDFGLIIPHQPVLAYDKVRFVGEPIALVVAKTEEAAEKGAERIDVEYKKLPAYCTPFESIKDDAVPIHSKGNMLTEMKMRKGNYNNPLEGADVVVEDSYTTPFIEHAYLEPEGSLAVYEDRKMTVWCPSQSSHKFRELIAATMGMENEEVRVYLTRTGGAFGGREEPTVQIQSALGAYITGKPVKMVLNRRESIRMSTKRAETYLKYRTGATKDGKLVGAEIEIYSNTGAYASAGKPEASRNTGFAVGPYEIPNARVDTYGVYTNSQPSGAMRGFGNTQVCFASEVQMDRLARELNMDPMEFRLKNALEKGKATLTGHVLTKGIGIKDALYAVRDRLKQIPIEKSKPGKKIGIGVAGAYKNIGLGAGRPEDVGTVLGLNEDGTISLYIGSVDMGQGIDTALAQIAAQALDCYYKDVKVVAGDTLLSPDSGVTTASRMVFLGGNALVGCAPKFLAELRKRTAEKYDVEENSVVLSGRELREEKSGNRICDLKELVQQTGSFKVDYTYHPPKTEPVPDEPIPAYPDNTEVNHLHFAYSFGANGVIVEVDEKTGKVKVLNSVAAQDVGKAVNPKNVEGQIEGAVVMGMGYALSEKFTLKDGWPVQNNYAKLKLVRATEIPNIVPMIVEDNHPDGPYGAKGMGELPISPVAPAIVNAIYDAVGVQITNLPVDRELLKKE